MTWKIKGTITGIMSFRTHGFGWLSDSLHVGEEMAEYLMLMQEGQETGADSGDCFCFLWGNRNKVISFE